MHKRKNAKIAFFLVPTKFEFLSKLLLHKTDIHIIYLITTMSASRKKATAQVKDAEPVVQQPEVEVDKKEDKKEATPAEKKEKSPRKAKNVEKAPVEKKAPLTTFSTARLKSASAQTMVGFLPPISSWMRRRRLDASACSH